MGVRPSASVMPFALTMSSRSVPAPLPVRAVTVQPVPVPGACTTCVIFAPESPVETRLKLPAVTPATASLKLTVQLTCGWSVGLGRLREIDWSAGATGVWRIV